MNPNIRPMEGAPQFSLIVASEAAGVKETILFSLKHPFVVLSYKVIKIRFFGTASCVNSFKSYVHLGWKFFYFHRLLLLSRTKCFMTSCLHWIDICAQTAQHTTSLKWIFDSCPNLNGTVAWDTTLWSSWRIQIQNSSTIGRRLYMKNVILALVNNYWVRIITL